MNKGLVTLVLLAASGADLFAPKGSGSGVVGPRVASSVDTRFSYKGHVERANQLASDRSGRHRKRQVDAIDRELSEIYQATKVGIYPTPNLSRAIEGLLARREELAESLQSDPRGKAKTARALGLPYGASDLPEGMLSALRAQNPPTTYAQATRPRTAPAPRETESESAHAGPPRSFATEFFDQNPQLAADYARPRVIGHIDEEFGPDPERRPEGSVPVERALQIHELRDALTKARLGASQHLRSRSPVDFQATVSPPAPPVRGSWVEGFGESE